MVAAPFAAILSDRLGRRRAMFIGAIVIILGAVIVSTSSTVAQFVVGRFVLGMGIQVMTVAAPAYAVEISPPHWRGRCTGALQDSPSQSLFNLINPLQQAFTTRAGLAGRSLQPLSLLDAMPSTIITSGGSRSSSNVSLVL